ncbi:MAG: tetratricopeptide repeat protein [Imperialibacter sp.]
MLFIIPFVGKSANSEIEKAEQLLSQRNYTASSALFKNLLRSTADRSEKAFFNLRLAKIAVQTRAFDKAKSYLDSAETQLSTDQIDSLVLDYHLARGILLYETENTQEAIWSIELALAQSKKVHGTDSQHYAICLAWLGNIYGHKLFQIPRSLEYYREAAKSYDLLNAEEKAFLDYNIARVNHTRNDVETSLIYLNRAQPFYNSHDGYVAELGDCFNLRGLEFLYKGDTTHFFRNVNEAIRTVENDSIASYKLAKYYDNMGAVTKFTGNCEASLAFYKLALTAAINTKFNLVSLSNTYLNLGEHYGDCLHKTDSAIYYFKKSLEIRTALYGSKHSEVSAAWLHLAEFYSTGQSVDSALSFIQQALISEVRAFNSAKLSDNPKTPSDGYGLQFISILESKSKHLETKYRQTNDPTYLRYAFQTLVRADSLLNLVRENFQWDESRLVYKASLISIYNRAFSYGLKLYDLTNQESVIKTCYYLMENIRYSLLLDEIKNHDPNDIKVQLLKKEIFEISNKLSLTPTKGDLSESLSSQLDSTKQSLMTHYERLSGGERLLGSTVKRDVFDRTKNLSSILKSG